MIGAILALFIVSFPETLYSRTQFSNIEEMSYLRKYAYFGKVIDRKITKGDFLNNFRMLKYWTVIIPCVYYMTANVYGSILFVLTASSITKRLYHFDTGQTGLLLGVPLTIGCLIGESCTGWVSDLLINRYAKRHDGYRKPEARLQLCFLGLLLPVGLIIHGVCVSKHTPWIGLAVGMVIASIGVQAATTLTYTYVSDCYKPQAPEVLTIVNLHRQIYAFTLSFYALPFGDRDGYAVAWGTFAAVHFATWIPVVVLIWKGEGIRKRQGVPGLHQDL